MRAFLAMREEGESRQREQTVLTRRGRQKNGPQVFTPPILGTRECCHHMAKGTLQMNFRTKTLKERDHLRLPGRDKVITRTLTRGQEGRKGPPNRRDDGRRDRRDVKRETDLTRHR